jgi:hypothetical protein
MLDFDEILVSVKNPQIKKYLEESIKSYQVGNYRSAILAVWIATMFDLVKKFEILVDQREPTAIQKWNELKPKIEAHKNWEKELISAAKAAAMISSYEADTLDTLSKTRNRYAHPSFDDVGTLFDPTPEEVRYFIRTLYDIVLSQPAQLGAFYVSQLQEEIKDPNFFTNKLLADELVLVKDTVINRVKRINQKQIPRLIKELFQALNKPNNSEHELNILCFVINLWGAQSELQVSIDTSKYWDEYITVKGLNQTTLEAILNYPEFINSLSDKSHKIISSIFIKRFIQKTNYSESAIRFLASSNTVPLAQSILDDLPNIVALSKVIEKHQYYSQLLNTKFRDIFGKSILQETRAVLKTRDGYKVNPVLSALRTCGIWRMVDTLIQQEKENFANELLQSLNSSNFETMDLLDFNNRDEIPIKWIKLLIEEWLEILKNNPRYQEKLRYYWEYFLGLIERYTRELGDSPIQQEALVKLRCILEEYQIWNSVQNEEVDQEIKLALQNLLLVSAV